jgi:mono/diheme cytochrome c family protein
MTSKVHASLLVFVGAAAAAGVVLAAPGGGAETKPAAQVYESSIGGVIGASELPGKLGQGYLVYKKWCAGCHAPPFEPAPGDREKLSPISRLPLGTNLLEQRYHGSVPAALEQRTDLTPEIVAHFVRNGVNAMPPFRKTEITDSELDALSAYLARNGAGSKSGN